MRRRLDTIAPPNLSNPPLFLRRDGAKAKMGKCDSGYTSMTLQFATRDDIKTMESLGARLITAAADGDEAAVRAGGGCWNSSHWAVN